MKKFILSAFLILSFGSYAILNQPVLAEAPAAAPVATNDMKPTQQSFTSQTSALPPPVAYSENENEYEDDGEGEEGGIVAQAPVQNPTPAPAPVAPTPAPKPTPAPTAAPATKPKGQYTDGSYTGAPADAYYGTVQVKATISGGKLTNVQFLSYPSDRSTSRQINSVAMPYLIQEAIQAQSANVATVSGASHTSGAFRQSLGDALAQAKA